MSAMSAYAYPPAPGHSAEPYRATPSSHAALPPISLPPIRNLESGPLPSASHPPHQSQHFQLQHQHQHHFRQQAPPLLQQPHLLHHQPQHHYPAHHASQQPPQAPLLPAVGRSTMGSPLPPPPPPPPMHMGQYYHHPGQPLHPPPQHMGAGGDLHQPPLRYPLPANDGRMMSGGRHKKEIKRRTKTGCLTCRKRRIKCDEGHPTCRNCVKSKRECLGYDPIFKAQPGPAAIQPAPNSAASAQTPSASTSPYPPPPPGYPPQTAQTYPTTMPPTNQSSAAAPVPQYDYSAAIDPALEAAGHAADQSVYDGTHENRLGAKPTKVEHLLDVGNGFPPPQIPVPSNIPSTARDSVKQLYSTIYGLALDKFLETRWFSTRGLTHLLNDIHLLEKYNALIGRFGITAETNYRENLVTQSLEAHIIWETLLLCRQVSASISTTNASNAAIEISEGVHEAAKRLEVFEALITNQHLEPASVIQEEDQRRADSTPPPKTPLEEQLKTRELRFWRLVSKFTTLKEAAKRTPSSNPPSHGPSNTESGTEPATSTEKPEMSEIDQCLIDIRGLLDSRENRDVLYSIAIARHVGQRVADEDALKTPEERARYVALANSEDDPRAKLHVARTFIQQENSGKGTTQVVQRVCGMAIRSWGNR